MLKHEHILWYLESLDHARRSAQNDIEKALSEARKTLCGGCAYCMSTVKHKIILEQIAHDLIDIVKNLSDGMRSSYGFAKTMNSEGNFYRGFITDLGEYVLIYKTDHSAYRKKYAEEHGEERAYRMINIHGRGEKTHVLFCDRKSTPTEAQYRTLRELMIDAEGALSFHFELDTRHPA